MHEEALTQNTKRVLEALDRAGFAKDFYLAGGTALALYYGHRFSVDLDWFAERFSATPVFRKKLSEVGNLSVDSEGEGTLNGSLDGVKVSFFEYPYPLIAPKVHYKGGVELASRSDIAVMKLEAVASRGTYKDFIDLYFLLQEYTIDQLFGFLRQKFAGIEYNETHLLKSLTYFADAKKSEFPRMIAEVTWEEVQKSLLSAVDGYMKEVV